MSNRLRIRRKQAEGPCGEPQSKRQRLNSKTPDSLTSGGAIEVSARTSVVPESSYFETQSGAWCGMHALNNYRGGPFVKKDDSRRAADQVVKRLSEAGDGRTEGMEEWG